MPIDHFSLTVPLTKLEAMVIFLSTSLHHLGFKEITRPIPTVIGMGEGMPYFWLSTLEDGDEKTIDAILRKQHVAFNAKSKFAVILASRLIVILFVGELSRSASVCL